MNWRSSHVGWLGLALYVAAWDYAMSGTEGSSLTYGFQHVQARRHRHLIALGWGITTLHLFGLLPRRADPFIWAGQAFGRRTYVTISVDGQN